MTRELLQQLGAHELLKEWNEWGSVSMSPCTLDRLVELANMGEDKAASLKSDFEQFVNKYNALSDTERAELKDWVMKRFVEPTWKATKAFQRPDFARARFFPNAPQEGILLDVAPAHGCHGILVYRDHHKCRLQMHACDLLPEYNKLLTAAGVKVKHVDLRFDRLAEAYSDQRFDVVTLTEVLEHTTDEVERKVCEDLHHITRVGSHVLVTFPEKALSNPSSLNTDPLGHIRQPAIATLTERLPGFKILDSGKFFSGKVYQMFLIVERK